MTVAMSFAFAAICGVAAYVQTVTGFAFGLIVMGAVGLLGLMPLPDAAAVVSALVLVNAAMVLAKGWTDVARRPLAWVLASSIPALALGYLALELLSETRLDLLRLILGAAILLSALQLLRPPQAGSRSSRPPAHLIFGALSGLMGGLFSAAGPPLVYHLYRQPLSRAAVRETLVTAFAIGAVLRIGLVAGSGEAPEGWAAQTLLASPAVIAGTVLARHWPPPLSDRALRFAVFLLLALSGASLAAPAALQALSLIKP